MNRISRGLTNKDIANELQCSISKIEKSPVVAAVAEEAAESDMRSLLPMVVALSTAH
jgi:hypothetical protein